MPKKPGHGACRPINFFSFNDLETSEMAIEPDCYRNLQQHLDTMPGGFPAVASGLEIKILRRLFTEQEARFAVHLSMKPEPLKGIYARVKMNGYAFTKLQELIETMVKKGTVLANEAGYAEVHYCNASFSPGGIFNLQVDRLDKDLLLAYRGYMKEARALRKHPMDKNTVPLRTIPVEKSISLQEKNCISHYDDVRGIIERLDHPMAVANCICRQGQDMLGVRCAVTDLRETCLIIGADHAKRHVDLGIGRYITREEIVNILEKAQEDGLVLQPENSLNPEAICCCCGDCCVLLKQLKTFPHPANRFASNYFVEFTPELCTGCEQCIDQCQMDARVMADGLAIIDSDRCIGCGNCVVVCGENANHLVKRNNEYVPFENKTAYQMGLLRSR
jgi:ferredoxin